MTFREMLNQVLAEEVEYQPGYFVWQMEASIRDTFFGVLSACAQASEMDISDYFGGTA